MPVAAGKVCTRCGAEKPLSEFYARARDGISAWCKTCESQYKKDWRNKNRQHVKEYTRQYDAVNRPDRAKEWREKNRDRFNEWSRNYMKERRSQRAEYEARRRARIIGSYVEPVDRQRVFDMALGMCDLQLTDDCHRLLDPDGWHLEHKTAIINGGEHSYRNTQASCPPCNYYKYWQIDAGRGG
jgi:transcription elongation factor Elf1